MYFLSHNKAKGFTLLEFMASISIGVLILTTVVGSQSLYTESVALKGLVNDVSLDLRSAQIYGISVRQFTPVSGPSDFNSAYGLVFDTTYFNSYILFADKDPKNGYLDGPLGACNPSTTPECISLIPITRGNKISSMCTIAVGQTTCATSNVSRVYITFVRPSTDAKILAYDGTGALINTAYSGIKINFTSPKNLSRSITLLTTGQISVQ